MIPAFHEHASALIIHLPFWILRNLPLGLLHQLGNVLGQIAWIIGGKKKAWALRNLALCLPELTNTERERIARRSFGHYWKTLLEYPLVWTGDAARVRRLGVETQGLDLLESALAEGRGVIIAAMHLGSFETGIIPLSERYPMTGMYKPLAHQALDRLSYRGRTRFGGKLAPIVKRQGKHGIGSQLLRALKRGEIIYALPDRDPPRGQGVFVPYFGVKAHSPVLIPKLIQATGARLLICVGVRLPGARGFMTCLQAPPEGHDSADLATAVAAINAGIESCVRAYPEQYWWGDQRFRRQPYGERDLYTGRVQVRKPKAEEPPA